MTTSVDVGHCLGIDADRRVRRDDLAERAQRVTVALRCASATDTDETAIPHGLARLMIATQMPSVEGGPPCRVGVGEVVVGHLLTVQLLGLREPGPCGVVGVQRGRLCGFSP